MNMYNPEEISKKAVTLFKDGGWNCAEAVFLAIAENLLDEVPVNLASCLGGGIGGKRHLCGALSGAILSLGITHGRKEPFEEGRLRAYKASKEIYEKFQKTFHSTECWELTNCEQDKRKRKQEICPKYVEKAALFAAEIINRK